VSDDAGAAGGRGGRGTDDEDDEAGDDQWPEWVNELFEEVGAVIEFSGLSGGEGRFSFADDNGWGVDLLEVAPALSQVAEVGPDDGEEVYSPIYAIHLLGLHAAFGEVRDLGYRHDHRGYDEITVEGTVDGHEAVVVIRTTPFEDADPLSITHLTPGGSSIERRAPRSDADEDEEDEEDD
jgi:hypothetical protein